MFFFAGTLEWKNIPITRNYCRTMLLEKVVQAIAEKWPRGQWAATNFIIRIQQDGPQTHIPEKDEQFDQGLVEWGG